LHGGVHPCRWPELLIKGDGMIAMLLREIEKWRSRAQGHESESASLKAEQQHLKTELSHMREVDERNRRRLDEQALESIYAKGKFETQLSEVREEVRVEREESLRSLVEAQVWTELVDTLDRELAETREQLRRAEQEIRDLRRYEPSAIASRNDKLIGVVLREAAGGWRPWEPPAQLDEHGQELGIEWTYEAWLEPQGLHQLLASPLEAILDDPRAEPQLRTNAGRRAVLHALATHASKEEIASLL